MLDEQQQPVIRVVGVIDQQDEREPAGDALEEDGPGGEEILSLEGADRTDAQQCTHPGPQPVPFLLVGHVGLEAELEEPVLVLRRLLRGGVVVLDEGPQPRTNGFCQREEGQALPVGHATAAVPAHGGGEAVGVLLELPRQTRLAHTRLAHHHQERRLPVLLDAVEELLDQPELAVASDQGRLEAVGALGAADGGDHRMDRPERDGIDLALEPV